MYFAVIPCTKHAFYAIYRKWCHIVSNLEGEQSLYTGSLCLWYRYPVHTSFLWQFVKRKKTKTKQNKNNKTLFIDGRPWSLNYMICHLTSELHDLSPYQSQIFNWVIFHLTSSFSGNSRSTVYCTQEFDRQFSRCCYNIFTVKDSRCNSIMMLHSFLVHCTNIMNCWEW